MCPKKDFPRYDDIQHIDSNAISSQFSNPVPRVDPDMLSYTEMYCAPGAYVDPGSFQNKKH